MRQRVTWGATLSLALALALSLTACIGPTVVTGLGKAGPYNLTVKIDPPTMQAGQKATLNFFFTDPANGNAPVSTLANAQQPLDMFAVDSHLAYFTHAESPGVSPTTNSYPVNVEFGPEGTYYLFGEFAPTLTVTDTKTGKKVPKTGDTVVYTSTIHFGTTAQAEAEPPTLGVDTRAKNAGGITIAMSGANDLHVNQPTTLVFSLSERGVPIHTLALYLGGAGQLVSLDAHGGHFAYIPALETLGLAGAGSTGTPVASAAPVGTTGAAPTATLGGFPALVTVVPSTALGGGIYGPNVTFQHTFDAPGLYKLWGQFLYRGQVLTADFVVNVQP